MTLPRVTISDVMALTVLAAGDCLVLREGLRGNSDVRLGLFFFGGLPLLNILMIGLVLLVKRRRRGMSCVFLAGFEAAGAPSCWCISGSSPGFLMSAGTSWTSWPLP